MRAVGGTDYRTEPYQNLHHPLGWKREYEEDSHMKLRLIAMLWMACREDVAKRKYKSCYINPKITTRKNICLQWQRPSILFLENKLNEDLPDDDELTFQLLHCDTNGLARMKPFNQSVSIADSITPAAKTNERSSCRDPNLVTIDFDFQVGVQAAKGAKKSKKANRATYKGSGRSEGNKKNGQKDEDDEEPEDDHKDDDHKDDDRRGDEDKSGDRKKEKREKKEREKEEREKEEREKEEQEKEEREKEEREKEEREKEEREKEEQEKGEREKEEQEKGEREKEEREKEEQEKGEREKEEQEEQGKNFDKLIEPITKNKSALSNAKVSRGKVCREKAKASVTDLISSIENVNSIDKRRPNSNQVFNDQDCQEDPLQDSLGVKSWGSDWITGTYQNLFTNKQKKSEFNESKQAQSFRQSSSNKGGNKDEDYNTIQAKSQKIKKICKSDNKNILDLDVSKNEVLDLCDGSEEQKKSTEAPNLDSFTTQQTPDSVDFLRIGDETSAWTDNKVHARDSTKFKKNKAMNPKNDLEEPPDPSNVDFASKKEPISSNIDTAIEANEESPKLNGTVHNSQPGPGFSEVDEAQNSADNFHENNVCEKMELPALKEANKSKFIKGKRNGYETVSQADEILEGVEERQAAGESARIFGADKSWKMSKSQKKAQEAAARKAEKDFKNSRKEEKDKLVEEANNEKDSGIIFKYGKNKRITKNQKKAQEAASSMAEKDKEMLPEEERREEKKLTEEAKTEAENIADEAQTGGENTIEEAKTEAENITEEAKTGEENSAEEANIGENIAEETKTEGENTIEEAKTDAENIAEETKTEGENITEEANIGENTAEETQIGEENSAEGAKIEAENIAEEAQIGEENSVEEARKEEESLAQDNNREKNAEKIVSNSKNKKVKKGQKKAQEAALREAENEEERLAGGAKTVEQNNVERANEEEEKIIFNNRKNMKMKKGQKKSQDSASCKAAKEKENEEKYVGEEEKIEPVEEIRKEEDKEAEAQTTVDEIAKEEQDNFAEIGIGEDGQAEEDKEAEAQTTVDEIAKEEQDNFEEIGIEEDIQANEDKFSEDKQVEPTIEAYTRVEESLLAENHTEEEATTQPEKTSAAEEEPENLGETGKEEPESQIEELNNEEDEASDSKVKLIVRTPSEDDDKVKASTAPAEKTPRSLMPLQPSKNTQSTKINRHTIKASSRKDEKKPSKVKSNGKENSKGSTIRNPSSIKDRQKDKAKNFRNPTTTKTGKVERPSLSRGLSNIFAPPVRSKSISEKNSRKIPAKVPRRASTSEGISGIDSRPALSSKAPKIVDVAKHSNQKSEKEAKPSDDKKPANVIKTNNIRNPKAKDNDIAAADKGGSSYYFAKRPETANKSSFSGIFSGLISSKSRSESKRRNLVSENGSRGLRREERKIKHHDRDNSDIKISSSADQENEKRQAARRTRRSERQAAENIAEEARRAEQAALKSKEERQKKYRKEKEEYDIRVLEEEKQSAARRAQRAHLDAERQIAQAKEQKRLERRRSERARDEERALFEAKERERQERRRAERAKDAERAIFEAKERERQERRRAERAKDTERALFEAKERERQERRRAERAQVAERMISEAREYERLERRRARQEKEAAHVISYDRHSENQTQSSNSIRRKSQGEGIDEDEMRHLRHEERRARRKSTGNPRSGRQKSVDRLPEIRNKNEPAEQMYEYIYEPSRRQTDDSLLNLRTKYWVREHSDAPPPPNDVQVRSGGSGERKERRRRLSSRHSTHEKFEDQASRERRRRSSHAARENTISLESSKGNERRSRRTDARRESTGINSRAPSTHGGLFSRWKRIAGV
ncbi:hypothetical protein BGT96224_Ac31044 [Blumeria graminis f. sp. tritici 96224]|uniref:Uncharacterized protein n=1 Tax=Blumeria graminis f. sp. tritici 96224 TaxID=1268274 RepID=A0A656KPM7_BLUGR|nr:hypothetical protein BGT96224_Ac31044 [Blumeria graminis f. sp. tritici 96224]